MAEFLTVAKVGEIPVGEGRAFEYDEQMVAVFNDGETYYAIDDMCPHMGASLASGHYENCVVTCPWHAWSFDTRDGTWCDNRRLKVDAYDVQVVGDEIQVRLRASDGQSATALGGGKIVEPAKSPATQERSTKDQAAEGKPHAGEQGGGGGDE